MLLVFFFFSSRRRHTRSLCDWSSDVCSSDLPWRLGIPAKEPSTTLCRGRHRSVTAASPRQAASEADRRRPYTQGLFIGRVQIAEAMQANLEVDETPNDGRTT